MKELAYNKIFIDMEIYKDGERLDLENISITKFENKLYGTFEKFVNEELDFSNIHILQGDKLLLEKAHLHQLMEELNT